MYYRHGTLSLYAALDVRSGKVLGKTAECNTSDEFIDFLGQVVSSCKSNQEIHIIVDNLSAHKTHKVANPLITGIKELPYVRPAFVIAIRLSRHLPSRLSPIESTISYGGRPQQKVTAQTARQQRKFSERDSSKGGM